MKNDKFSPQYDGENLIIHIETKYIQELCLPTIFSLFECLHKAIVNSVFKFFSRYKKIVLFSRRIW